MNLAIFGWIRIRRIENARIPLAGQWIGNRRSFCELRIGRLGDLLAEPNEN